MQFSAKSQCVRAVVKTATKTPPLFATTQQHEDIAAWCIVAKMTAVRESLKFKVPFVRLGEVLEEFTCDNQGVPSSVFSLNSYKLVLRFEN